MATKADSALTKELEHKHKVYNEKIERWKKNRLICAGSDAVKDAGTVFLPQLSGQDTNEYDAMVMRANFFPGALRALQGVNGMIHAKTPTVNFPENKKDVLDHIGISGTSIAEVSEEITEEQIMQGWVGIYTFYEMDVRELRPFMTAIRAENIWDWAFSVVKGKRQLSYVKFTEEVTVRNDSKGLSEERVQVTQLWLSADETLSYRVCQKKVSGGGEGYWMVTTPLTKATVRGNAIKSMPFRLVGARKSQGKPEEAPIEPICDVNISHYITSADLEQGRHFTALPTPWICSSEVDPDKDFRVGGYNVWIIPETEAKVGMLEYTGQGLLSLEKADSEKKWEMAVLGARMLQNDKKANESKDTVRLRQTGENSIVTNVARNCSVAVTYLLKEFIAPWVLVVNSDKVNFALTTDFLTIEISTEMLNSMAMLVSTNKMSMESFFYNLQRGGIYEAGTTLEKELAGIQDNLSMGVGTKDDDVDLDDADDDLDDKDNPADTQDKDRKIDNRMKSDKTE